MRKNLVVVRAGDSSLHPQWLDGQDRTFDIYVSYYGKQDNPYEASRDGIHYFKGSKWAGLHDFFEKNPELIDRYSHIALPDDDMLISRSELDAFFATMAASGLVLAQPALKLGSYYSYRVTIQHPFSSVRKTNFVEIMFPCFESRFFRQVLWTLGCNDSGWGMEWLWQRAAAGNGQSIGIIDKHPVLHTRPVNKLGNGGAINEPLAEMKALLLKHDIKADKPANIDQPVRNLMRRMLLTLFKGIRRLAFHGV